MFSQVPQSQNPPLAAELVDPEGESLANRRLLATLVALAPVALRVGWWYWRQTRRPGKTDTQAGAPTTVFERTEMKMTKHLLGRWKLKLVTTRWQPMAAPLADRRQGPDWYAGLELLRRARSARSPLSVGSSPTQPARLTTPRARPLR